jgi:hypothetical protein
MFIGVYTDIWLVAYGIVGIGFILAIQFILIQPWLTAKRIEEKDSYKRF